MPGSITIREAMGFVAAAMLASTPTAFAHTTVRDQITEGKTADNAVRIGHACEQPAGNVLPIIAQSVVFPTVAPQISTSDGSAITALSQVIVQGSVAGLLSPIQDRSIFEAQQVKYDALGNKIGFSGTLGFMSGEMPGRVPFQFTSPNFVANSCAKRLLVKIAIADICVQGALENLRAGAANLWIPDNGSTYSIAGSAAGIDGIGSPATLTVNRDLAANPLAPACGAGIDVTVTPSPADVEANLPIPGLWRHRSP